LFIHCSRGALLGAIEAAREGLIEPVLVGPQSEIQAIAMEQELDISAYRLVDVPHSHAAAVKAVQMAASSEVEALMKGSLHTDELMGEAVKHDGGLRTERRISHVFAMADENHHKPFFITDAAVNITPDLLAKKDIVQNAIDLVVSISEQPAVLKVAVLSAAETVSPPLTPRVCAKWLTANKSPVQFSTARWHTTMPSARKLLISREFVRKSRATPIFS
jgi:phosphotransacetylase